MKTELILSVSKLKKGQMYKVFYNDIRFNPYKHILCIYVGKIGLVDKNYKDSLGRRYTEYTYKFYDIKNKKQIDYIPSFKRNLYIYEVIGE